MDKSYKIKVRFPATPMMPEEYTGYVILKANGSYQDVKSELIQKLGRVSRFACYISHEEVVE